MSRRKRTAGQFGRETLRALTWIIAGGTLLIIFANMHSHRSTEQIPDPITTVTTSPVLSDGVCNSEDASPEWWGDPDCYGAQANPREGSAGFDCRTNGNHVCGPGSAYPAGCYSNGTLAVAWSNYAEPKLDPLYGQLTPPC